MNWVRRFCSSLASVLAHNGNDFTFLEFQTNFKVIVFCCSIVSGVIAFLFQLPKKLRNVFEEAAIDRIKLYDSINHEIESQIDTTDGLLLKYGLITEKDIKPRKSET